MSLHLKYHLVISRQNSKTFKIVYKTPNVTNTADVLSFVEDMKLHYSCTYTLLQFQARTNFYTRGTTFFQPIKGEFYGRKYASHTIFALDLRTQEVYRLVRGSTKTLLHQALDGLPLNLVETFLLPPVAENTPRYKIECENGVFVLTPQNWADYYKSGRSSHLLSDLGINIIKTPLNTEQASLL